MFKQAKGITLVSLVITIIVMLILAGVSLSMVMGENSVLDQATQAVDETERSTVADEASLAVGAVQTKYYGQYSATTGRKTMKEVLKGELSFKDFTSASEVKLAIQDYTVTVDGTSYTYEASLIITHKNGNVYQTYLDVTDVGISVVGVECTQRNGSAVTGTTAIAQTAAVTLNASNPMYGYPVAP